jgi:hypothetical protein
MHVIELQCGKTGSCGKCSSYYFTCTILDNYIRISDQTRFQSM